MRALACGLVCVFMGAGALRADDQADARALVDKALKALGGADKVAKFKGGAW